MYIFPCLNHIPSPEAHLWHPENREDGSYLASACPCDGQNCERENSSLCFHGTMTPCSYLPLMHLSIREPFRRWSCPNFADVSSSTFCYTVRELTMLAWINELTDIPDWQCRVFDPDFMFKWKSSKISTGQDVTRSMAEWVRSKSLFRGEILI